MMRIRRGAFQCLLALCSAYYLGDVKETGVGRCAHALVVAAQPRLAER